MENFSQQTVPETCDVLIIGGGPAGSTAATHLSQNGINVVLFERTEFPREQVGESLIPHFWKFTDLTGVSEKIKAEGFLSKSGGVTVWDGKIHQILFSEFGYTRPGLHVERDIFDHLLLQHAQSSDANIYTQVAVKNVDFTGSEPVVHYLDKRGDCNEKGKIRCQYVIDASGHNSFLPKQFKTRKVVSSDLNFLSVWGYFKNSRYIGVDRVSHETDLLPEIRPVTFVMSFAEGWIWHIILRNKASVGLVVHTDRTRGMDKQQLIKFYIQTCNSYPYLNKLLESAVLIPDSIRFRPDYSYYSTHICGENYYCIGDAGAFVDPVFSHGVQNAFYNAAITSMAIQESLKNKKHRIRYSRLCESRMQQFYGFSRALSLGDFGMNGVDRKLVKNLMKSLPPLELELLLVASEMTNRSENFRQLAREAGVWDTFQNRVYESGAERITMLEL